MKPLRIVALMLAVGASTIFSAQAYGQQEVDPAHFDQPSVAQAKANGSKSQGKHKATAANHHHRSNLKLASKHSGSTVNHHHAHVSA